ncbi:hypothetical protein BKA62DRAFT_332198 [Auriculariales sp. MPI-PUGE-AT-0066]|nr:hypothetical protein BKA62DRAFT_332198 [Auriculariales sp. MPI-PUGE-AT-0066]
MAFPTSIQANTWDPHANKLNNPYEDALAGCLDPNQGYNLYEMEINAYYHLHNSKEQNVTLTLQGVAGTEWQIASATRGTSSSRCITFTFAIALLPAGTIGGPESGISIHFDLASTPYHFVVTDAHLDGDISLPSSTHTLNSTSTSPSPYSSSSTSNASPTSEITQSSSANVSSSRKSTPARTVALAVIIPVFVLLMTIIGGFYFLRRHRQRRHAKNSGAVCAFEKRYSHMPPAMIVERAAHGRDAISLPRTDSVRHASLTSTQPPSYVSEDGTVLPGYASVAGEADGSAPHYSIEDEKRLLRILQARLPLTCRSPM